jgi:hypothetical protein
MSMLARFRKPGGFQQLLALIETCEPAKQKALLHLIAVEDPGWAQLVRLKTLSFERILSWPVEILMEITPPLPDKVLATAYQIAETISTPNPQAAPQVFKESLHEKWLQSLPSLKAREIRQMAAELSPTAAEQSATVIRLIQIVRELESKGQIRFQQFDPLLEVDKDLAA